jgi:hypothetical protein
MTVTHSASVRLVVARIITTMHRQLDLQRLTTDPDPNALLPAQQEAPSSPSTPLMWSSRLMYSENARQGTRQPDLLFTVPNMFVSSSVLRTMRQCDGQIVVPRRTTAITQGQNAQRAVSALASLYIYSTFILLSVQAAEDEQDRSRT